MRLGMAILAASLLLALALVLPAMGESSNVTMSDDLKDALNNTSFPPRGEDNGVVESPEMIIRPMNWTRTEEYARGIEEKKNLMEQANRTIKKKSNWVPAMDENQEWQYLTQDMFYCIAQFWIEVPSIAYANGYNTTSPKVEGEWKQPDIVVMLNITSGGQYNMTWKEFQEAQEYGMT